MSGFGARFVEHVHGHLGWLSTVALYHPAILLRRPRRRALSSALLATALVTVSGLLGALLYPDYRERLKPTIFARSPAVGDAFERKEHLAVAAVVLAWAGLVAHWAACRDGFTEARLDRAAFVAYAGAATLATIAACLGILVATHLTF
jgi:hypothetical protein